MLRLRFLDNASVWVIFGQEFRRRLGLPRFSFEVKVPELSGGHEPRGPEDEVHALKLRLDLGDGLQIEPAKHSTARSLLVFPGFLDAQGKTVLHDLDQRALSGLRHVLGHVLDDRIFGESGLEVHVRKHRQHNCGDKIVQKVAIPGQPKPVQVPSAWILRDLLLTRVHDFPREQLLARHSLHSGVLVVHVRARLVFRRRPHSVRFVKVVHVHPLRERRDEAKSGSRLPRL